jgi:tRNA G18 (ribose-2'-O)-methylase SpoU
LFVAESRLVVERLLDDGRFQVHSVAVTPPAAAAMEPLFAHHPDTPVYLCEALILQAITGFDFHRGCLALARRNENLAALADLALTTRLLALEGIANPDNIGGLFRAASALGAEGVLLDPASGDPLYRKAIRTSMGATLRVPFTRVEPWPMAMDDLRFRGFQVVALTPDPAASSIDAHVVEPGSRLILVVGSEGAGLQPGTMRYADVRLRIPINPGADSLNVVVAAAIALKAFDKCQMPNAKA